MSRRLGLTAAAAAAGVLVVYVLLVRTGAGQRIDEAALDGRTRAHGVALRAAEDLLASITAGTLAWPSSPSPPPRSCSGAAGPRSRPPSRSSPRW